jgi:hypothetical protein
MSRSQPRAAPGPAAGETFTRSRQKEFGWILVCAFIGLCAGLTLVQLALGNLPPPRGSGYLGVALAGLAVVAVPFAIGSSLARLVAGERLILADECVQIVRAADRIRLHIPYCNIAQVGVGSDALGGYVGVRLLDPDDPETHNSTNEPLERDAGRDGWHYRLRGGYTLDVEGIAALLLAFTRAYRERGAPSAAPVCTGPVPPAEEPAPADGCPPPAVPAAGDETFARRCPMCGGFAVRIKRPRALEPEHFQFRSDRECKTCGALWRPAIPRWGAGLMIGLGVLVLAGAAVFTTVVVPAGEENLCTFVWGLSGLAAVCSIGYGGFALLGVCGQLGLRRGPVARDR